MILRDFWHPLAAQFGTQYRPRVTKSTNGSVSRDPRTFLDVHHVACQLHLDTMDEFWVVTEIDFHVFLMISGCCG